MALLKWRFLVVAGFFLAVNPAAFANNSCGRQIVFNCDKHVATLGQLTSPLDCGVSTPSRYHGRIGNTGKAPGKTWKCLKDKPMVNLGLGDVIAHTPCHGHSPKGQNQTFKHSGCLNVNQRMLLALQGCTGTPFEIEYESRGRPRNTYANRRHQREHQRSSLAGT